MEAKIYHVLIFILLGSLPARAQIRPDSSLGSEGSIVNQDQMRLEINGGASRGSTLFHSFREFSIQSGQRVYFSNPPNVQQIITRVTGNQRSLINGQLGVLGAANLYLLNPNGIIFGRESALDLKGSLIVTTGVGIDFAQYSYNAINPNSPPLISVGNPQAINFKGSPGEIIINGNGGVVTQGALNFVPANTQDLPLGLSVSPYQTIALIGGQITLAGGVLTAPSGNIDLISINRGQVLIEPFNFRPVSQEEPQNILLSRSSLLNASGLGNSRINLFGNDILFTDNSLALIENRGLTNGGEINFKAEGRIDITNDTPFSRPLPPDRITNFGGILSQTYIGKGASISIAAEDMNLLNNGLIYSSSFGPGTTGSITLNIENRLNLQTESSFIRPLPNGSVITTVGVGTGGSANVQIRSKLLNMQDSSSIISSTIGSGQGGDVNIVSSEEIKLTGINPFSQFPTIISTATIGEAQGGNLFLKTQKLEMTGGSRIDASALQAGRSGSLIIEANQINLSGAVGTNPTLITSSASRLDPVLAGFLGVTLRDDATSGNIRITSQNLSIFDGAQLTVRNDAKGDGGTIFVNTKELFLINGQITASTNGGNGGSVDLSASQVISLNRGNISATAVSRGTGGNIEIRTPLLLSREGLIGANAQEAQGGQIAIQTGALLLDSKALITASSALGPSFDGQIRIDNQTTILNRTTIPNITIAAPALAQLCDPKVASSNLSVRSIGGNMINLNQPIQPERNQQVASDQPAVAWRKNTDGTISFIGAEEYISQAKQQLCVAPGS